MSDSTQVTNVAPGTDPWQRRVDSGDWDAIRAELDSCGGALLPQLLTPEEAQQIRGLYGQAGRFRSTVNMAAHRFGEGEYRYFAAPYPEPVERLKQEPFDVVLMDCQMPVMDGYEFLGNLRRMPGGDQPKVVFCTTENDVAHIARALHAGANEYIMKPFDKDIVTAKFQEVGLI